MLKNTISLNKTYKETSSIDSNYFVYIPFKVRYLLIAVSVLYIFLVGIFNITQWQFDVSIIYFSLLSYIIILFIPIIFFRSNWGLFHPLVFLCLWNFFRIVIPSTLLYINGMESHNALSGYSSSSLNSLIAKELLLSTISIVMMFIGYFVIRKYKTPLFNIKEPKFVMVKLLIVALISTIAILILANAVGGIGNLFLQRGMAPDMQAEAILGGGHWSIITTMLIPACLVAMSLKISLIKNPLFICLFLYSLVLKFATDGSRSGVIIPIILFLIIWSIHRKKIPYGKFVMVCITAIFILGLLGNFRDVSSQVSSVNEIQLNNSIIHSLESGLRVFNSYSGEAKGLYPVLEKAGSEVDLLYGESYLSIVVAPIPRAIWPSKPEGAGKLVSSEFFGNPISSNPPGSVGEAYWNFHIPGILIVFFIWGMILKWLTNFYVDNPKKKVIIPIYAITILLLEPNGMAFYDWIFMLVPALMFIMFCCGLPKITKRNVH